MFSLSLSLRARVISSLLFLYKKGGRRGLQKSVLVDTWEEEGRGRKKRVRQAVLSLSLSLSLALLSLSFFDMRSSLPSAHRFSFISMGIGRLAAALSPADWIFGFRGRERDGRRRRGKKKRELRLSVLSWSASTSNFLRSRRPAIMAAFSACISLLRNLGGRSAMSKRLRARAGAKKSAPTMT